MTSAVRDDAKAIEAIERRGILLVYPIANQDEPRSLWSELHPRTRMTWAWDASADARVARMWHLRERLATSLSVAYTKWFRGRATFIALEVFRAMLSRLASEGELTAGLSRDATTLLELLEDDSPQSTKVLRANAQLQGRRNETIYARALKELWSRLLIVGVGEVADGAFPSLQMSATRLRFEPLWPQGSAEPHPSAADASRLDAVLADSPLFARELDKTRRIIRRQQSGVPIANGDGGCVASGATRIR
jgi:hypothetical protein